jgi:hypothetical protein
MKKALLTVAGIVVSMANTVAAAPIDRELIIAAAPAVSSGLFDGYQLYWTGYWGPAWTGPAYAYPRSGEVTLETAGREAAVFINGSYAGTTKENKIMRLRPGCYRIQLREGNETLYLDHVFVTVGKTVRLRPIL